MKKYSIVGICQIYNELQKGNLERFMKYVQPLVDALVVYDDGSTDGSYEYMLRQTPYILRGTKNEFVNERNHKQLLLQEALKLSPDFILWLDADEVMTADAAEGLQRLCAFCEENQFDAVNFHELNLWRSQSWRRVDSQFNDGWFCRLWRVVPGIGYEHTNQGLHQPPYPSTIRRAISTNEVQVLHYGFSSKQQLAYKYLVYKAHGQRGYEMLDRLISEEKLMLEKVPRELFPEGLWFDDERPEPLTFEEALTYVEQLREYVYGPKFSLICLVYKNVEWLKFVHEQVLKYTDLTDKEFFFVANDASEAVLGYLRDNYIPHYVHNNTSEQRTEWFINNVYRAYNFAATKAKGDFLIFVNSDMAFTPGWFEHLWEGYNGANCVTSRLVESGKLRSGQYGIEKSFGLDYSSYQETSFQQYAASIRVLGDTATLVQTGGLFMPLLIRKQHFLMVGGYPAGNIVAGSPIFDPVIAKQGQACISGDNVLMAKLQTQGIAHQTALNSIAYHFQCGEADSVPTKQVIPRGTKIAICNDLVTGTMGEKVLWNFLLEALPGSVGIDIRMVGDHGDYAAMAQEYIATHYPEVQVIIQNATFINIVDESRYTIAFLQDDLRAMGRNTSQQEQNLRAARKLVTNSIRNTLSYPEYDFEIIPVGIDLELFKPMDKSVVRAELGFGAERVGIFVGDFSEVKGWNKIKECIICFPDISWILVSKHNEAFAAENVRVFNRIPQHVLVKLLNCADFFIIGSPVETQCLAAIEACACNIPVIMRKVGIFKDFSEQERSKCGMFGEDFISGIREVPNRVFSPRQVVLDKGLAVPDSMQKWQQLLTRVFQELRIQKI